MVSRLNASAVIHGDLSAEQWKVRNSASSKCSKHEKLRRYELTNDHFENKTCCEKKNLRICSEELVEVVEIDRLEIAALNLLHQAFKLSEKGTTCEQRKQQSNK